MAVEVKYEVFKPQASMDNISRMGQRQVSCLAKDPI